MNDSRLNNQSLITELIKYGTTSDADNLIVLPGIDQDYFSSLVNHYLSKKYNNKKITPVDFFRVLQSLAELLASKQPDSRNAWSIVAGNYYFKQHQFEILTQRKTDKLDLLYVLENLNEPKHYFGGLPTQCYKKIFDELNDCINAYPIKNISKQGVNQLFEIAPKNISLQEHIMLVLLNKVISEKVLEFPDLKQTQLPIELSSNIAKYLTNLYTDYVANLTL